MSNLKYWLAFSKIYSIGSVRLNKLIEYYGSIEECWHASTGDLLKVEGLTCATIEKFQEEKKNLGDPEKLEQEILEKNINVITLESEDYPYYLKQIYDPPIVLFTYGDAPLCWNKNCLAVVGSRRASHYIKQVLKKIIYDLQGTDITIVSGMAVGVDTCAHTAAIESDLSTIAVLGSGFDHIYPKSNMELFQQIIDKNSAIVSEYFPDAQPLPMRFPRRNRIISGLSGGTLIAEAGLNSGALITASLCLEQNRELMCIPGLVTNPNTEGTHKLIKDGAAVVTKAEDILDHLGWQKKFVNYDTNENKKINLLDKEKKIYEILDLEPRSFDDLVQESGLNAEELMSTLTTMELTGLITQKPGQKFVKNIS